MYTVLTIKNYIKIFSVINELVIHSFCVLSQGGYMHVLGDSENLQSIEDKLLERWDLSSLPSPVNKYFSATILHDDADNLMSFIFLFCQSLRKNIVWIIKAIIINSCLWQCQRYLGLGPGLLSMHDWPQSICILQVIKTYHGLINRKIHVHYEVSYCLIYLSMIPTYEELNCKRG